GQRPLGDGVRHLVVDCLSDRLRRHPVPRPVHAGHVDQRIHRPAQPARPDGSMTVQAAPQSDALTIDRLKAYYINQHYGVSREVRAVDDVSLVVRRNEIYGLAGESSSGKTSLIKTLAGAIRPPMQVIDGSVTFNFGGETVDVYRQPDRMRRARWR